MKLISFSMTEQAIRERRKFVTRRLGWKDLKPGTPLVAVNKRMGLRRGEHPERLATIVVLGVRRERLDAITADDVRLEGFPEMSPAEFVLRFCRAMRVDPDQEVTRIEFDYAASPTQLRLLQWKGLRIGEVDAPSA